MFKWLRFQPESEFADVLSQPLRFLTISSRNPSITTPHSSVYGSEENGFDVIVKLFCPGEPSSKIVTL